MKNENIPVSFLSIYQIMVFTANLINRPAGGMGDVILGLKYKQYLEHLYDVKINILTTYPDLFRVLGYKGPLYEMAEYECDAGGPVPFPSADIALEAPMIIGEDLDIERSRGCGAEVDHIGFMAEYQSPTGDIRPGVGPDYDGLLFDITPISVPFPVWTHLGPYFVMYQDEANYDGWIPFILMLVSKYKYNQLNIIMRRMDFEEAWAMASQKLRDLLPDWNLVRILPGQVTKPIQTTPFSRHIIFREDILPVPRPYFLSLLQQSQPDLLVTGDVSLTDALQYTSKKVIWYDAPSYKIELAEALGQAFIDLGYEEYGTLISDPATSMGAHGVNIAPIDYTKFISDENFLTKSRKKMVQFIERLLSR